MAEIIFWILLILVVYAYLAYPFIIAIINIFKKQFVKDDGNRNINYEPKVTLFIAAYNEIDFVETKIKNSLSLNYPKDKIEFVWVTDGSDDGTNLELQKYENIKVLHQNERKGKIGAINRGMAYVNTPIVIFSDANSLLNKGAIREIVKEFADKKVGCVAGEKRISAGDKDNAVNSGEGIYWKYESFIKRNESGLSSVVGAVGELFAIRTELFETIEEDTILDDLIISLRIALKGYKIKYTPNAYATEKASANINEELKRKIRIAYGGFQAISRLLPILNPLRHPLLSFQYNSHKILRWAVVPFAILMLFPLNFFIAYAYNWQGIFSYFFYLQILFYSLAFAGFIMRSKSLKNKVLFAPYYIFIMNLAQILGCIRFIRKKQTVNWERAKRG